MKINFSSTGIDLFLLLQKRMKLASSSNNTGNSTVKRIINNLYKECWTKHGNFVKKVIRNHHDNKNCTSEEIENLAHSLLLYIIQHLNTDKINYENEDTGIKSYIKSVGRDFSYKKKILAYTKYQDYKEEKDNIIIDAALSNYSTVDNTFERIVQQEIIEAFKYLSKQKQQILTYWLKNYTDKEISNILSTSVNVVRSQRSMALKKLRLLFNRKKGVKIE